MTKKRKIAAAATCAAIAALWAVVTPSAKVDEVAEYRAHLYESTRAFYQLEASANAELKKSDALSDEINSVLHNNPAARLFGAPRKS